jgi:hypothetical protein
MSGIIGGAGSKSGVIGETEIDYEEGTWTPGFTNNDGSTGYYVKIGTCVWISGLLICGSGGASSIIFTGLPFATGASGKSGGGHTINYTGSNFDISACGWNHAGNTEFKLCGGNGDANENHDLQTSTNCLIAGHYHNIT